VFKRWCSRVFSRLISGGFHPSLFFFFMDPLGRRRDVPIMCVFLCCSLLFSPFVSCALGELEFSVLRRIPFSEKETLYRLNSPPRHGPQIRLLCSILSKGNYVRQFSFGLFLFATVSRILPPLRPHKSGGRL